MGDSFGDGVIVAAIAAAVVAYLYFGHVERKRRLEIVHEERLAAMDKGIRCRSFPSTRQAPERAGSACDAAARDCVDDPGVGSMIYRITFNQALNVKARVRYRAPHVSDRALAALPAQDPDPYDRLQNARRQQAILAFVEELPEGYQGGSVSDIAVLLDVPQNTVKSYLTVPGGCCMSGSPNEGSMHDDEQMDQLLRDAMTAEAPQLSSGFDARVLRRVRPRRLTPIGRAVIAAYAVIAVAATVWLMRDVQTTWIVTAGAIGAPVAAAASVYGRRLAVGR